MKASSLTAKTIWDREDAHPIALDTLLIERYGANWLAWEAETLSEEIQKDFGPVSGLNFSKIEACKTLHLVDTYWQRWEVFVWCTMPCNSMPPDFLLMQVPTVAQVLASVDAANRIRTDVAFSEEVRLFMANVHRHDGIALALPPVSFVELSPHDFALSPEQDAALKSAWAKRDQHPPDPMVREQMARLVTVSTYLDETRDRLREQLHAVTHAA
ncbi:hypothetical protein LVJ94_34975 [Pendulispora rubella]|uniref:Uncharacterized protein n=1 Tax=Pendulispora rubella TaxID=2741070 RepID=A0ABZ2KU62_9BACT